MAAHPLNGAAHKNSVAGAMAESKILRIYFTVNPCLR
jgi:hypothetical protein